MPKSKRTIGQLKAQLGRMRGYREMLAQYKRGFNVGRRHPYKQNIVGYSTGAVPKNKKMAWWYLPYVNPKNTRKLLDQMRDTGKFGGKPGTAPYWLIQEKGMPEVGIQGIHYLQNAISTWKQGLQARIGQQLRGR